MLKNNTIISECYNKINDYEYVFHFDKYPDSFIKHILIIKVKLNIGLIKRNKYEIYPFLSIRNCFQ